MNRKTELLAIINREKPLLPASEHAILDALRQQVMHNPNDFIPMSDAEYEILSDSERAADNSRSRINYILSREIEYLLINRTIPRRLIDWMTERKAIIVGSSAAFGAAGKAVVYYYEHKDAVDQAAHKFISLLLSAEEGEAEESNADIESLSPEDLFKQAGQHSELVDLLVDISAEGISEPTDMQLSEIGWTRKV
jgi:uncharacterized protein YfiM (DUF2279 family)